MRGVGVCLRVRRIRVCRGVCVETEGSARLLPAAPLIVFSFADHQAESFISPLQIMPLGHQALCNIHKLYDRLAELV